MKERLFTRNYIFILAANFLLFFGFWILIPVLPFYLRETYDCPAAMLGAILSCYTVSGLCVRPFSGYLMDKFPRKPIYIFCYFICASIFLGYIAAGVLTWFIVLRALHGVAFSSVTVGGNTLCVDITPSSRRGEALGYYGLTNNIAMALGPMTGLFMHDHVTYNGIFLTGMAFSVTGLMCAICVKSRTPESIKARQAHKQRTGTDPASPKRKLSLDRFILIKGIPVSIALLMLSIPYGATTNFVAMYAREIYLDVPSGFFFTLMAVGMGASRLVAGKKSRPGIHNPVHPHRPVSGCRSLLHTQHVPLRSTGLHGRGRSDVFRRSVAPGHRLRRHLPCDEHSLHQPRAQQPARHSHKHIPYGVGRRHRHWHSHKRADSPAFHILHGLPHRLRAMPRVNDLFQHESDTPLQQKQT